MLKQVSKALKYTSNRHIANQLSWLGTRLGAKRRDGTLYHISDAAVRNWITGKNVLDNLSFMVLQALVDQKCKGLSIPALLRKYRFV